MLILRHVLIALTYTAFAVALAVTLPYSFPDLSGSEALIIGGLFFLVAALLHEVFARFEREGEMVRLVLTPAKLDGNDWIAGRVYSSNRCPA